MLVHVKQILKKAQQGKYAIVAFNTPDLEITLGIVRAAVKKRSPIILQVSEATIEYAGLIPIFNIIRNVAETEGQKIPIAVHLDHGHDLKTIKACLKAGFSSVQIDASKYSFKKNIAISQKAVAYAHTQGAWAQAELGAMLGKEGMTKINSKADAGQYLTDPALVKEFIRRTKADALAVSVGTLHGCFVGKEKVDYKRVAAIAQETKAPLVLHGASGIAGRELKRAVKNGIRVVNVDTALRLAFTKELRRTLKREKKFVDPRKILTPSIKAVEKIAMEIISAVGSAGKI